MEVYCFMTGLPWTCYLPASVFRLLYLTGMVGLCFPFSRTAKLISTAMSAVYIPTSNIFWFQVSMFFAAVYSHLVRCEMLSHHAFAFFNLITLESLLVSLVVYTFLGGGCPFKSFAHFLIALFSPCCLLSSFFTLKFVFFHLSLDGKTLNPSKHR